MAKQIKGKSGTTYIIEGGTETHIYYDDATSRYFITTAESWDEMESGKYESYSLWCASGSVDLGDPDGYEDEEDAIAVAAEIENDRLTTFGGGLTRAQIEEVKAEQVSNGVPVRFMRGGEAINIVTGEGSGKGVNIMHQRVYWNFTKETSQKIARLLGARAVFSK